MSCLEPHLAHDNVLKKHWPGYLGSSLRVGPDQPHLAFMSFFFFFFKQLCKCTRFSTSILWLRDISVVLHFQFLAFMNKAAVNMAEQMSLR